MWAGSGWLGYGVRRRGHPSMYACQLMVPCVESAEKLMKSSPRLGAVCGQGSGLRACGRRVQCGTACTRRCAARAGSGVRGSGRRAQRGSARTHWQRDARERAGLAHLYLFGVPYCLDSCSFAARCQTAPIRRL